MRTTAIAFTIAALAACSDDAEPGRCDDPTGRYLVTLQWVQGTCNVPTASITFDVIVTARGAVWDANAPQLGTGSLTTRIETDGACTLVVMLAGNDGTNNTTYSFQLFEKADRDGHLGSGMFTAKSSVSECFESFTVTAVMEI